MKRVFAKTEEVARAWANGTHNDNEGARTSSNTRCRLGRLYSYGTCVAAIHGEFAPLVALIDSGQYSSGTSKVQNEAAAAARRAGHIVFRVAWVLPDKDDGHANNLCDYVDRIDAALAKIENARPYHSYRGDALKLIGEAYLYALTFGLDWKYAGRNPLGVTARSEMP